MGSDYLLDTPAEAHRLVTKVDAHSWVRKYLSDIECTRPILEIGSGPMHLLREATRFIGQPGIGIDISIERLTYARPGSGGAVEDPSTNSDATHTRASEPQPVCATAEALPFVSDSFGLTFARFVAEYLPNPEDSIREMLRVTTPGGRIILQDLDGQILQNYPVSPDLQRALEAFVSRTNGRIDPYVGRKLFTFAQRAGLHDIEVTIEPYHVIAGTAEPGTLAQWRVKLANALPAAAAILGAAEAKTLMNQFLQYLQDPATLTFSNLFTVSGRCPDR